MLEGFRPLRLRGVPVRDLRSLRLRGVPVRGLLVEVVLLSCLAFQGAIEVWGMICLSRGKMFSCFATPGVFGFARLCCAGLPHTGFAIEA